MGIIIGNCPCNSTRGSNSVTSSRCDRTSDSSQGKTFNLLLEISDSRRSRGTPCGRPGINSGSQIDITALE
ncbi:MAG: hypothetical protein VKL02_10365 [Cylindrospermopsis raciborskii 1523720]|uniref:hypothetical protein n=1 Tax=Cylindrospermopsis raciborskii TaxID=77022 RepID=UPI002B489C0F|nr:hypothetical protein [Cylindrospermopsis raciborskii]MEB3146526.1 hypothetical protein [Cylindrospermopsis raciborskii]